MINGSRKPEKLDDIAVQAICRQFMATALGGPDTTLSAARERNLRAYNAEPVHEFAPPEIEDRSEFVSSDVADTINGMIPQMLDVFVSNDEAMEAEPKKPGDLAEAQAKHVTGYLNHLFYVRNDGLNVLHDWLQDACLQKMGWVKVWSEEEEEDASERYEGATEDQLAAIMQDGAQIDGEPLVDEDGLLYFTVSKREKRIRHKVAAVAPHKMRIDPNARWGSDPGAIGEVDYLPRYQLEEMGYDVSGIGADSPNDMAANYQLGEIDEDSFDSIHDSHRLYEYAELYLQLDIDGDGVAEWSQICLIGGEIQKVEKTDDHPYAEICLMPRAHAYIGDCPADAAYVIQKEQTALWRSILDNYRFSVNQRTYINTRSGVNVSDLLDNRPGGFVRGEGPPGDAFAPIPTLPISSTAFQVQEALNVKLENRTGFTRYSQGMDADSLNKTATGVSIITQKADMRIRLMTRFAAQGLRKMFAKLLKQATRHQDAQDWYRVNGEFVPVNPYEWRDLYDIKINVGLGHGTKEQQMGRLMAMWPLQQAGLMAGVVRPEHIANTILEAAKINEYRNPERFADEQPTGMPPNPQAFQQMQQQIEQQMQQMGQQLQQMQAENEQLKQQVADKSLDFEIKSRQLDQKNMEIGLKAREQSHVEKTETDRLDMERNAPERLQAEGERAGMEAFTQAAIMLAEAAKAITINQVSPRTLQIALPDGRIITGQSAPVEMIDGR